MIQTGEWMHPLQIRMTGKLQLEVSWAPDNLPVSSFFFTFVKSLTWKGSPQSCDFFQFSDLLQCLQSPEQKEENFTKEEVDDNVKYTEISEKIICKMLFFKKFQLGGHRWLGK